jgi:hypothetical protein
MKTYLRIFFSALLILVSCTREPLAEEGVETVFSLVADNADTKAVGDASAVDQLSVLAWDKDGNSLDYLTFTCTQDGPGRFSAKARLVRGVEYTLLFFAQKEGTYTLGKDGCLNLSGFGATSDAARDAFSAVLKMKAGESSTLSLSLRRPFALLRFVSSPADQQVAWEEHRLDGIRSRVELENVPNKLNLLTGAVEGSVKASFAEADAPAEGEMAYVFVPAGETESLVNAVVTVTAEDFASVRQITGIPLRRNHVTKIEGDFLTTEGVLDINLGGD